MFLTVNSPNNYFIRCLLMVQGGLVIFDDGPESSGPGSRLARPFDR